MSLFKIDPNNVNSFLNSLSQIFMEKNKEKLDYYGIKDDSMVDCETMISSDE